MCYRIVLLCWTQLCRRATTGFHSDMVNTQSVTLRPDSTIPAPKWSNQLSFSMVGRVRTDFPAVYFVTFPFYHWTRFFPLCLSSDRSPAAKRQRTASADTDSEYLPFRAVSAICCLSIRGGLISQMFKTRGSILPVLDMGNRWFIPFAAFFHGDSFGKLSGEFPGKQPPQKLRKTSHIRAKKASSC